jgi:hypothetical protein
VIEGSEIFGAFLFAGVQQHYVISGLVPAIPIGKARRFKPSGSPAQGR